MNVEIERNGDGEVAEVALAALVESLADGDSAPTRDEATAISAAVCAHLNDRARAAAAAAEQSQDETVSQWTLSGRLESVGVRGRRPRQVERGTEWKAAARTV